MVMGLAVPHFIMYGNVYFDSIKEQIVKIYVNKILVRAVLVLSNYLNMAREGNCNPYFELYFELDKFLNKSSFFMRAMFSKRLLSSKLGLRAS